MSAATKRTIRNRANAARSTGPTTPAGKDRSAQNAATHHGFCANVVLPGEDEIRFRALRRSILAGLNPQTAAELFLADRACALIWRLDRCQLAEFGLDYGCRLDRQRKIERYRQTHADATNLPATFAPDFVPPAATFLATAYGRPDADNPFDRLARAEQRLHGMLNTALRRLQALQSHRHHQQAAETPDPTCPYLELLPDDDDDPEELQYEPIRPAATPTGAPASVGHANPHPQPHAIRKLQNEPTAPPDPGPSVAKSSSSSSCPSCLRGSPPPRTNPKTAHALFQAATRAAGDLLPPPAPPPPPPPPR
jgi:hypothetical protein